MSPSEEIKREGCEVKGVGKYLTMSFYDFCYVMGMDPEMGFDFCSQEDASEEYSNYKKRIKSGKNYWRCATTAGLPIGVSFDGGLIF